MVSLDSTYTTNQYNMIFVPITGVNHHLQSVFLGASFLPNENIESYVWLFKTFLKAMGGVPPHLIITDEDASMKATISKILPDTHHKLCMWHIMDKVPEKVGPSLREDQDFYDRLNSCVWGSETPEEFESNWSSFINDFHLT
jgi:transposase-like protein